MSQSVRLTIYFIIGLSIYASFSQVPMIIIPGYGCSRLEAKLEAVKGNSWWCRTSSDWYQIWLSPFYNIFAQSCFMNNIKMHYDSTTDYMVNSPGVSVRTDPIFGSCGSAVSSTRFGSITISLDVLIKYISKELNYTKNKDVFVAGYDFRSIGDSREMKQYFGCLEKLIVNTSRTLQSKILLVSHGLGSSLVSHFLNQRTHLWKSHYIDSWFSISGTFGGSFMPLKSQLIGSDFPFPRLTQWARMKDVYSTFSSTYFLLPSEKAHLSKVLVRIENDTYTASNLRELVIKYNDSQIFHIFKHIPQIFVDEKPGVPLSCVYGSGHGTISKIIFEGPIDQVDPIFEYDDGDGFSTAQSLSLCKTWHKNKQQLVDIHEIRGASHFDIVGNPYLHRYLRDFIRNRQKGNGRLKKSALNLID